ncbi:hypothetical protein POVWA2_097970 [Plasmodium ovale wallikeri]|uniref:PIR Superfamily Protein n=1 Tax=Plasmodium ovale wallikeri TaxID=864142 RepID=A0A1A9ATH5_PLAOA|nr:hypothetical protein POVWA2_097970 [Plasmodium ovale wallikeri]
MCPYYEYNTNYNEPQNKKINEQYCNKPGSKNIKTCEHISPFLTTYRSYIQDWAQIRDKITSPTFTEKEYLGECAAKEESEAIISGNDNNPVVGEVTGTLAGTCISLLALYKYPPFYIGSPKLDPCYVFDYNVGIEKTTM